jgi:hypothetical protein
MAMENSRVLVPLRRSSLLQSLDVIMSRFPRLWVTLSFPLPLRTKVPYIPSRRHELLIVLPHHTLYLPFTVYLSILVL